MKILTIFLALLLTACQPYMTYDEMNEEAQRTGDSTRVEAFETGIEGVLSLPAVAWDGSGYGVIYSREIEDRFPEPPMDQLEFIRLGCTTID